nr:hypothetical protein [Tanacetum cinerariifolium]
MPHSSVVGCVVVGAVMNNDIRERDGVKAVMQGTTDVHGTTGPKQPTSSHEFLYANVVNSGLVKNKVNFRALESDMGNVEAGLIIPMASHGLQKVMVNNGRFFFKFFYKHGLGNLLENGSYMIHNVPMKWSPDANLIIEDLTKVPMWVKLHNVPMVAFTSDGFSISATKLGNPIVLDSYTSSMCMKYWGCSTFACALIELDATCGLKDMLVVVTPKLEATHNRRPGNKRVFRIVSRMLKSAYKKKTTSAPVSNVFSALEEDNGKPMDALVDDTQKKVV